MVGSYINTNYSVKWTYLIYSSFGLFVLALSLNLSKEIDTEGLDTLKGFWVELKKTGRQIVEISKIGIVQNTVLFLLFEGIFQPSFGEFHLYYMTDWRDISKYQIGT
jgi:hypothetical protein